MDVVGAIGGALSAAMWVVVGTRLVSRMRPNRQMPAFTIGVIVFALAGGLIGSTIEIGDASGPTAFISTVGTREPAPSGVIPPPPSPEPTTATTTTTVVTEPPTTTTTARATTTTRRVRRRSTTRATTRVSSRTITARCNDGWGIYGTNRTTTACDAHGGIAYWIVQPTG